LLQLLPQAALGGRSDEKLTSTHSTRQINQLRKHSQYLLEVVAYFTNCWRVWGLIQASSSKLVT